MLYQNYRKLLLFFLKDSLGLSGTKSCVVTRNTFVLHSSSDASGTRVALRKQMKM
jgi:hypothetical protein